MHTKLTKVDDGEGNEHQCKTEQRHSSHSSPSSILKEARVTHRVKGEEKGHHEEDSSEAAHPSPSLSSFSLVNLVQDGVFVSFLG